MNGFYIAKDYPEHLRRIRFKDPQTGATLVFLTNNTTLPPLMIAALYKNRWQVELFFRLIKQHLRIKRFLGTSENAVKTQIWSAVATYVLIAIVKKELHLDVTCLVFSSQFHLETLAPVVDSGIHCDTNSSGVPDFDTFERKWLI